MRRCHARRIGLDIRRFESCLTNEAPPIVRRQILAAGQLGLTGTPAFLIGELLPNGTVLARKRLQGAVSFETFQSLGRIDRSLTASAFLPSVTE